jgi:oligosaccharide repeat unit polymerase
MKRSARQFVPQGNYRMNRQEGVKTIGSGRVSAGSTAIIIVGLLVTYLVGFSADRVNGLFTIAAVGVGLSLAIATAVEGAAGVRSLIRVDILILWVLYGLTLLEFLFPQPESEAVISLDAAMNGMLAVILGFAGLAIGRHLVPWRQTSRVMAFPNVRPKHIFALFILATVLGYLHILLAVNFDLLEMLREMSLPRGAQSWGRGQYGGDLSSLLFEVGALIYLIPPIAGLIYARASEFQPMQKVFVTVVFLVTMYYGFAGGTRNVLATYVITFCGAYFLNKRNIQLSKIVFQGCAVAVALLVLMYYMLEFRNAGLSNFSFSEQGRDTLYIDHNIVIISELTNVFPSQYGFLGLEIPFSALIHPIPRMLWPGKPEGLSVGIESAVGATQATVSSTFVGEAYMSGGMLGVVLAGLLLGAAAELWNRVGRDTKSPFSQLLYASGFFCAAITMRSVLWMSVTMLPSLALWIYGKFFVPGFARPGPRSAFSPKKNT